MGVYIKGMEMPTEQYGKMVITLYPNGHVAEYVGDIGRVWEAVPVPPHGRLVDMGEIEERIDSCCDDIDCSKTMCNECAVQIVMNKVFDAPTIIPAEEGE